MYLSTLFLSEIRNGVRQAIGKCNEEFVKRIAPNQTANPGSADEEMMALWDVYHEFEEESLVLFPVVRAMNNVRAAQGPAWG